MGQKSTTQKRFHTGETTGVMTLTNKKLEKIPKKIFTMGNLRVLDISNNKLKMLPQEMSVLKNLKTLRSKNVCVFLLRLVIKLTKSKYQRYEIL